MKMRWQPAVRCAPAYHDDPTYIASQARERLGYAKPGETQYAVVGPGDDQQSGLASATTTNPSREWR